MIRQPSYLAAGLPAAVRALCAAGLFAAVAAAGAGSAPATQEQQGLPPAPEIARWIDDSEAVRLARRRTAVDDAAAARLRLGPYETGLRVGVARRKDPAGGQSEREFALERTFRWGDKAALDRTLADQDVLVGRLAIADARHEAAREFLGGWAAVAGAGEQLAIARQAAELMSVQFALVERRVRAGDAARAELVLAQASVAQSAQAVATADEQYQAAISRLVTQFPSAQADRTAAIGVPAALDGDLNWWTQRALADNHELKLVRGAAQRMALAVERQRAERRPDPLLGARLASERAGSEHVVGVYLAFPFAGEVRERALEQAAAERTVADERVIVTERRVAAEIAALWRRAERARNSWDRAREAADGFERYVALASRAYALGEATLSDVLLARRQALDARRVEAQARTDAVHARWRLALDAHLLWDFDDAPDAAGPEPRR